MIIDSQVHHLWPARGLAAEIRLATSGAEECVVTLCLLCSSRA